jgi:hypothetical protein
MIIKAIKQLFETQTSLLQKKAGTYTDEVVCSVDDVVDCEKFKESYVGVPAPTYLQSDEWFGAPVITEKGMDVVQQEAQIKQQQEEQKEELIASGILIEDEDIHQRMYELATKNWNTVAETQGGSENFHEGPGGWNSGNGMGQFQ